jgi:segregation and condensation protein B
MGRPILYRTSKEFLMRFGLSDLDELPSLKEFEQLARAALGADEGIATAEPEAESQTESTTDSAVPTQLGTSQNENSSEPRAIPETAAGAAAQSNPHDSRKSADEKPEQSAENPKVESASS